MNTWSLSGECEEIRKECKEASAVVGELSEVCGTLERVLKEGEGVVGKKMASVPAHCDVRRIIRKIREKKHSLRRTFAAMSTWANAGECEAIRKECADATVVVASLSELCGKLEVVLKKGE